MVFNFFKKKNKQRLLTSGDDKESSIGLDYGKILEYVNSPQYTKDLHVSFFPISLKYRKKLIKNIELIENEDISSSYDTVPLYEGMISGRPFISLKRKSNRLNRIRQTIITEGLYIDISTKRNNKNEKYIDLQYKRIKNKDNIKDVYIIDAEEESYFRKVKKDGLIFIESASYSNEDKIIEVELLAQPSEIQNEVKEYNKITGLPYIANLNKCRISDIIKAEPFLVNICIMRDDGNINTKNRLEIIKVFKSKKECIVGYRPELILLKGFDKINNDVSVYRLLKDGKYVDNKSFKVNFEGKYYVKKVDIKDIEHLIGDVPFSISDEAKSILRNGLEIEEYIRTIYDSGVDKIKQSEGSD